MNSLSVIIVNYNTKELCRQTIRSIRETTRSVDYEIIVVDNSSNKQEALLCNEEGIMLLSGVENKGFSHACNLGAKMAKGDHLLFLNSDTILHDGALDKSTDYLLSHSSVGALGIRTVLENGGLDHGCKRGFPTPMRSLCYFLKLDRVFPKVKLFGGYRLTYLDDRKTAEVDSVSGAFLMMPRHVFEEVGGFDEAFFMYGEDVDLCYRIKEKGYTIVYCADAGMLHLRGQSGLHSKNPEVLYHFYNSMLLFYDKNYKRKYGVIVTWLIHLAIRLKGRIAGVRL